MLQTLTLLFLVLSLILWLATNYQTTLCSEYVLQNELHMQDKSYRKWKNDKDDAEPPPKEDDAQTEGNNGRYVQSG